MALYVTEGKGELTVFYDEETAGLLEQAFDSGCNVKLACDYVGITQSQFNEWMQDPEFSRRIRRARAKMAKRNLGSLQLAGAKDWRAARTALEYAFPDELKSTNDEPEDKATPFKQMAFRVEEA